jgi:hypothetical protein
MMVDQSEILCSPTGRFIPQGLIIMVGITATLAYEIWHDSLLSPSGREM